MRFHIPGIPHTATNKHYISCAYTQKVYKLCDMLINLGHEVYHYGCEGSDPKCTEHVNVMTEEMRNRFYPDDFTQYYKFDTTDELHMTYRANCVKEINRRAKDRDFLLCQWGYGHQPISTAMDRKMMVIEPGIGYEDTFASYRVFESYAWMHYVYGKNKQTNGSWYDAVIPNYFDPKDFTYNDKKDDFFLYLGRIGKNKGVEVAVQVTQAIGAKLIIAGQGTMVNPSEQIDLRAPHVEFAGFADVEKRRDLMSRAKALFVPTYYIEPFGGVAVEAMMSGTPVITSDWGVFSETVLHGITGYRCRTFDHFCWAALSLDKIKHQACKDWAVNNYSLSRVGLMYQEYFDAIYDLWDKGWYSNHSEERNNLDWLYKHFPEHTPHVACGNVFKREAPEIMPAVDPFSIVGMISDNSKKKSNIDADSCADEKPEPVLNIVAAEPASDFVIENISTNVIQKDHVPILNAVNKSRFMAHTVNQPDSDITAFFLSCDRLHLLSTAVSTFLSTSKEKVKLVICDDSGNPAVYKQLLKDYGKEFDILCFPENRGQWEAFDFMTSYCFTKYIFYVEDDWEFYKDGYLQLSKEILESNREIGTVDLSDRRYPDLGDQGQATDKFIWKNNWRISDNHWYWCGWCGSPNLKRREDLIWLGRTACLAPEWVIDRKFYSMGLKSVYLLDGYVKHLGDKESRMAGKYIKDSITPCQRCPLDSFCKLPRTNWHYLDNNEPICKG
jgi:glycosyltransferase involved in cell wall biosynthesis